MRYTLRHRLFSAAALLTFGLTALSLPGQIRDGGIDPWNLGKGDWIYYMSMATNRLGGNVSSVTNETSLMLFYKSVGVRYIIVKAATSDLLVQWQLQLSAVHHATWSTSPTPTAS